MSARQQRVEARKAKGLAKIAAKSESGYWSPEGIEARQSTLQGAISAGGDILGGILGDGGSAEDAWDEAGYSDAAAFEGAYPDEAATLGEFDEYGNLIEFPTGDPDQGEDEPMEIPWVWIGAGGAALVGGYLYMNRNTRKGDVRKTARRAFMG